MLQEGSGDMPISSSPQAAAAAKLPTSAYVTPADASAHARAVPSPIGAAEEERAKRVVERIRKNLEEKEAKEAATRAAARAAALAEDSEEDEEVEEPIVSAAVQWVCSWPTKL